MPAPLQTAGPAVRPTDLLQLEPSLAVLLLLSGVVVALIYAYQPPFPQTAVFAFLPWLVAGSFLNLLATQGLYPPYLEPLFAQPGAYVTALFIPGLVWTAMLNVSVSNRELPAYHHYIGAMGLGAVVIIWTVLLVNLQAAALSRMLILVVVPLTALLATGLLALSIGLWSPDFIEYTPITGGFTVFGALVYGTATILGVGVGGPTAHSVFSATVYEILAVGLPDGVAGVGVARLWAPVFVLANLAIGIHVATTLAKHADESPRRVHLMLATAGGVAFTLGFNHLLVTVVVG